jgi:hypothetical protein
MKINIFAFGGFSLVVAIAVVSAFVVVKPALAQVDATSTETVAFSSEPGTPTDGTAATTANAETAASSADAASGDLETGAPSAPTSPTETSSVTPTEPAPEGLTEVHIIGTKYIDYFTDGTTVTAYPGDPEIDSHFAQKDAPIPTHEGLTWVHTTGGYLYDTSSGDLEVGQYALQANGTYISNAPPSTFVPSTSTPAVLGASTEVPADSSSVSTSAPATSSDTSSTSTATDGSTSSTAPTTTSAGSTSSDVVSLSTGEVLPSDASFTGEQLTSSSTPTP